MGREEIGKNKRKSRACGVGKKDNQGAKSNRRREKKKRRAGAPTMGPKKKGLIGKRRRGGTRVKSGRRPKKSILHGQKLEKICKGPVRRKRDAEDTSESEKTMEKRKMEKKLRV